MTYKAKKIILTFAPPLAAALVFALRRYILIISERMPGCAFHALTGLLCPGCGNTRAARELLSLHFLSALRYNITLPLLIVFAVLLYAQYVISAWIKPVKLVPRTAAFYIVCAALLVIYFIARNIINFMP